MFRKFIRLFLFSYYEKDDIRSREKRKKTQRSLINQRRMKKNE